MRSVSDTFREAVNSAGQFGLWVKPQQWEAPLIYAYFILSYKHHSIENNIQLF